MSHAPPEERVGHGQDVGGDAPATTLGEAEMAGQDKLRNPPPRGNDEEAIGVTDTSIAEEQREADDDSSAQVSRLLDLLELESSGEGDTDTGAVPEIERIIHYVAQKRPEQLDDTTTWGRTALHLAIHQNLEDVFHQLLQARALLAEIADEYGDTPLHDASSLGRLKFAEELVERKVDVNARNHNGITPLHYACRGDEADLVRFLLRHNANTTLADERGRPPLHYAAYWDSTEAVESFVRDKQGNPTQDIDQPDKEGSTPLHWAVIGNEPDMVSFLLEKGANIKKANKKGCQALHVACMHGLEDIAKKLVDEGADCNEGDTEGRTPLHLACLAGREEVVRMLLTIPPPRAPSIDQQDHFGDPPLHIAAKHGHVHVINTLLRAEVKPKKVNPNQKNKQGFTALHTACLHDATDSYGNEDAEDFIFTPAAPSPYLDIIETLKSHGANLSETTNEGRTALHLVACTKTPQEILEVMEIMGPERYSLKDKAGKTALHIAVEREDPSVILAILGKMRSPKFDFKNKEKEARNAAFGQGKNKRMSKALLGFFKALKPQAYGREDWTLVEWAAVEGHPKLLWDVLVETPRTNESNDIIKNALEELTKPKQEDGKTALPTKPRDPQRATEKVTADRDGKVETTSQEQELIKTILMNPPITEKSFPWLELKKPTGVTGVPPSDMEAGVLEFFTENDTFAFLRHSTKVENVIYGDGPRQIMHDLKNRLQETKEKFDGKSANKMPDANLTWVHLPANNLKWMKDLTTRIWWDKKPPNKSPGPSGVEDSDGNKNPLKLHFNTAMRFLKGSCRELPENSSEKRFMRPGCKSLRDETEAPEEADDAKEDGDSKNMEEERSPDYPHDLKAIYMPYLRFATECEPGDPAQPEPPAKDTSRGVQDTNSDPNRYPNARKTHNSFLKNYADDLVHGSRTLDEFYYQHLIANEKEDGSPPKPGSKSDAQQMRLADIEVRNRTQVVSRHFHSGELMSQSHWDILRVDQLWMWIIDEKTIISSSTHPFDGTRDPVLDSVIRSLGKELVNLKLQDRTSNTDVNKLSRLIIQVCTSFYDKAWRPSVKKTESVRHIFANTLNDIAIREADLLKIYHKRQIEGGHLTDETSAISYSSKARDNTMYAKNIEKEKAKTRKTPPQHQMRADIVETLKLFYEIKDTSDELNILLKLAKYQQEVQTKLCGRLVGKGDKKASNIVDHLEEKITLAKSIREAVETILSLQQSELSIVQNQLAIQQGNTLMIFTIFTIVFLPASFISSLFALDIASFLESPRWAFGVIGGAFFFMAMFSAWMYREALQRLLQWFTRKPLERIPSSEVQETSSHTSLPNTQPIHERNFTRLLRRRPAVQRDPEVGKEMKEDED